MIELSADQGKALDAEAEVPPRVVDPRTKRVYVLLGTDQYERLKSVLDPGPITEDERRVIVAGVWKRANWDDPRMDALAAT
ncbi:MAG TPA: hypothetical protein VND64_08960 [Pirellulales bacterium]|nr:hypothetical protein [Pirellulales bacterium]